MLILLKYTLIYDNIYIIHYNSINMKKISLTKIDILQYLTIIKHIRSVYVIITMKKMVVLIQIMIKA